MVELTTLRKQIEGYIKEMGYYSSNIKLTSTKSIGNSVEIKGYFREYLGESKKFSATYDMTNDDWGEFTIEDEDQER